MDLNPDDRIGLRIEILRSAEGLHTDGVFLQTVGASLEDPRCQELK
jgi:hypothetical protein